VKESTPMRVVAVDDEGIVEVRPLGLLERLAYYGAYAAGWVAAEIYHLREKLHGKQDPKG
jgi:hypothetical protein